MHLIIGNKNYSSWSLRPWLLMMEMNIPFEEIRIPLYLKGSKDEILKHSPSGKVPALEYNGTTVWDSLAICEYISDLYPDKGCWPHGLEDRALARSISSEMHSGFFEIRNTLPMNCRKKMIFTNISPALQAEIERICAIWRLCRGKYSRLGEYLFGAFSIADVMYAPIVLRFNSYGIVVGNVERLYMNTILANPSLQRWVAEGVKESEVIPACEVRE